MKTPWLVCLLPVAVAIAQGSQHLNRDVTRELVFPFGEPGGAVLQPLANLSAESPFSLCIWLKGSLQTSFARILVVFVANTTIFVTRSGTMVAVRTELQLIDVHEPPMTPRNWHHMCIVRHHHYHFDLFLDGHSFQSSSYPANDSQVEERRSRNMQALMTMKESALRYVERGDLTDDSILILGAPESPFDVPVGRVADLRVFDAALTPEDVAALRSCRGDLAHDVNVRLAYVTPASVVRNITLSRLCQPDRFHVITYTDYIKHTEAASLCENLGGSLPNPQDFTDLRYMTETLPMHSGKDAMYLWLSNSTNFTALGIEDEWCCALNIQFGGSLPMAAPCDTWARDFVCLVPHGESVSLLYRDEEIKLFYGDGGENFLMISEQGFALSHSNDSYFIRNIVGDDIGSRKGSQISTVLGLRHWETVNAGVEYVTLSTCLPEEFTCISGECVSLKKRCDKLPNCDDASDEDDCYYLLQPPATYRSYVPPSQNAAVGLQVSVSNIHDINMKENQIGITVEVRLNWTDARLTFTNMCSKVRLDEGIGRIWLPNIDLIGAKYENNVKLRKGIDDLRFLYAQSAVDGTRTIVNSSRALMSRGKDVDLELLLILDLSISCSYDLTLYPFDVQQCALKLALAADLSGATRWNERFLHVTDAFPQVALYTISHVHLFRHTQTEVHVKFLLERHFGSYMLTSYFPCLILLVIGSSTLMYPVSAASDRVMVTLSCLIVLASLLAQASATLPESASSKAIEVWFFYTISRMFLVSVVHTGVYRSVSQHSSFPRVHPVEPLRRSKNSTAVRRSPVGRMKSRWHSWSPEGITRAGLVVGAILDLIFLVSYVATIALARRGIITAQT